MPARQPVGARVEIVEPWTERASASAGSLADLPCIKPSRILVNGTDVGLVERDSLVIDHGAHDRPVRVTLTLLVKSVEIKAV